MRSHERRCGVGRFAKDAKGRDKVRAFRLKGDREIQEIDVHLPILKVN